VENPSSRHKKLWTSWQKSSCGGFVCVGVWLWWFIVDIVWFVVVGGELG